jgi:hypothetical protein
VMVQHMGALPYDTAQALLTVNKAWSREIDLVKTGMDDWQNAHPELYAALAAECNDGVSVRDYFKRCDVRLMKVLGLLKRVMRLMNRTKGQPFRPILRPFVDGSLLRAPTDLTRREEYVAPTMRLMMAIHKMLPDSLPHTAVECNPKDYVAIWMIEYLYIVSHKNRVLRKFIPIIKTKARSFLEANVTQRMEPCIAHRIDNILMNIVDKH